MRLVVGNSGPKFSRPYSTHDVVLVPELYCTPDDNTMFEQLLAELKVRVVHACCISHRSPWGLKRLQAWY